MARRKVKNTKNNKPSNKAKKMKLAALIASAIQDLREVKGTTPKQISEYISYVSDLPEGQVKRQVKSALRRGVEYGILCRNRGQYFLPAGDEMDRANKMALRFSKLPDKKTSKTLQKSTKKDTLSRYSSTTNLDWEDIESD